MSTEKNVGHPCPIGLKKLKDGNAQHVKSIEEQSGRKIEEIGVTESGQRPYAAILSCADSRVIPESIFSAKEGELFVVRVAGNIANTSSIASLEYAVAVLNVRIIVVLGHESCGAVKAAIDQAQKRINFGTNLNQLLAHIVPAINGTEPNEPVNDPKQATINNARLTAEQLVEQSEILRGFFESGHLGIFNGYYNIYGAHPGKVDNIDSWNCPKPVV
ncbi:MAG: carbonic anhydrase [Saprospiraceae bacterium]|jgi:carbonic anhydrase|tara:strand:- start:1196 stop:1846 length:651 start_codon:yes stop_codon:yes gene_type:complete